MNSSSIIAALAGLSVGIFIALLVFLSAKKKIRAFTSKVLYDSQNLRYELNTKTNQIELHAYEESEGSEAVIYDSSGSNMQEDFTGRGARAWDYVAHSFSNNEGAGSHHIENGTITIQRSNTVGRYELYLKKYFFETQMEKIPADSAITKRRLLFSCEVKKGTASHILRFVFKGEATQDVLDEKDYVVFSPEWEKLKLVFSISALEPSYLRIDDLSVLDAPGNVQIRNIVLCQKG